MPQTFTIISPFVSLFKTSIFTLPQNANSVVAMNKFATTQKLQNYKYTALHLLVLIFRSSMKTKQIFAITMVIYWNIHHQHIHRYTHVWPGQYLGLNWDLYSTTTTTVPLCTHHHVWGGAATLGHLHMVQPVPTTILVVYYYHHFYWSVHLSSVCGGQCDKLGLYNGN